MRRLGGFGRRITGIVIIVILISAMLTAMVQLTITMRTIVMGLRQDPYASMIKPSNFFNTIKVKVGKDNILLRRRTPPCLH
jgi:Na+/proline symporter